MDLPEDKEDELQRTCLGREMFAEEEEAKKKFTTSEEVKKSRKGIQNQTQHNYGAREELCWKTEEHLRSYREADEGNKDIGSTTEVKNENINSFRDLSFQDNVKMSLKKRLFWKQCKY